MSTDLHSLVGPYALEALNLRERTSFESHLAGCRDCQAELAAFQTTAARLDDVEASPSG